MSRVSIDHVVINTRYQLDAAAEQFAKQGFLLTDRGHHTLGSINHLMMFGDDYLELIGLPAPDGGEPVQRAGVSDAPVGINGLVFKTDDAEQTYQHLCDMNMQADPPRHFSRPVVIGGEQKQARFCTVHARRDVFPAGRLYFCQHLTSELVWRPQWQQHANGAKRISEVVMVSEAPDDTAQRLSALLGSAVVPGSDQSPGCVTVPVDDAVISICSQRRFEERYGPLSQDATHRSEYFGALVVQCEPDGLADLLEQTAVLEATSHLVRTTESGLAVRNKQFDALLEYAPWHAVP